MSDDPITPKQPQRRAAQEFVERLPLLTGSTQPAASHSRSTVTNPLTSNPTTTQHTSKNSKSTQDSSPSSSAKGKRKAIDEPPEYALQPEPLPKRVKSSTMSKEAIMAYLYDQLVDPSHQEIWLREALSHCGVDDLEADMGVSELEDFYCEILNDPNTDVEADMDNTPQGTLGVSTGLVTPMTGGRPLTSTNHTTIGFTPALSELPRDSKGKPDLSGVALDNPSFSPSTSTPKGSNAPVPVPAEIRCPRGKPLPDLRRAVLKRTQWKVNSAMVATQGGPLTTVSPKGSQSTSSGLRIQTQSSAHSAPTALSTSPAVSLSASVAPGPPIPHPIAPLPSRTSGASSSTPSSSGASGAATPHVHAAVTSNTAGASSSCTPATSSSSTQAAANLTKPTQPVNTRVTSPPYPASPPSVAPPSRRVASRKVAKVNVPVQPPPPAEPEEDHKDDEDEDEAHNLPEEDQVPDPPLDHTPSTKRQWTQLRRFGPLYGPVVKKTAEFMLLRMLMRCPFPEVTAVPMEDDTDAEADGGLQNPARWSLFDEWIPKCWIKANQFERDGEPMLPMEAVHRDWILLQVPQPRTSLRVHLEVSAPIIYGFWRKKCTANVQLSENLIHQNAFIFLDSDKVKTIFCNPCIGDAIYSVFFKNNGIGRQYPKLFAEIPLPLIAFTCAILRHIICGYRTSEWKKENLSATLDNWWYWQYMAWLRQLAWDTPTQLNNIQEMLRQQCLGDDPADEQDDSEGSIDLGSDSDPEDF
ncbi:hypothetical protein FRC08_001606 [Ceratobasidium sp. 394]|nr:hypothetical protein FRC08_001606 [Ceratobasidium sp. 394]